MSFENFCIEEDCEPNEGTTGLENLEKIITQLGYEADGFDRGTLIENFLKDNSGAIEVLYNFVSQHFQEDFSDWEEVDE